MKGKLDNLVVSLPKSRSGEELMRISVRHFGKEDIGFAYEMTLVEQWNERRSDVARMFDFEPEGCFVAEVDGAQAGHVFSIAYGTLGWIGLLIVSADHRMKGIGTVLMKKAIQYLLSQDVETIKLDAVPEIADLYRKLGFIDEYASLRFMGSNQNTYAFKTQTIMSIDNGLIGNVAKFDARYFGADRTRVLARLFSENPELSFVSCSGSRINGYITCRKAEIGYELGPWICDPRLSANAQELFAACMDRVEPNSKVYVGLPPNSAAVKILENHGFRQYSESIRMRFGKELRTENSDGIFAIAGPMKG